VQAYGTVPSVSPVDGKSFIVTSRLLLNLPEYLV
jgi:hypothetical protein